MTDIAPVQTESTLTTKHPINVLQDVLTVCLGIDSERVNIYNQKFKIPTDNGIYIIIGFLGGKLYRTRSENVIVPLNSTVNTYGEALMLNTREIYSIDIISKSEEAFFRKEEILMALVSQYCKSQQELYNFTIARIPSQFNDVSDVEGASRLYRFNVNVNVLAWYYKTVAVDYYNTFGVQVRVDNRQGLNSTQVSFTQDHG